MSNERLSDLMTLAIYKTRLEKLDNSDIIDNFTKIHGNTRIALF